MPQSGFINLPVFGPALIDTDAFYNDWTSDGRVREGTTRLKNFNYFKPENWLEDNYGCQANTLAWMNLWKHEKELIDSPTSPVPADVRATGRGGTLLWLTDKLYECIQAVPGHQDFPSKKWQKSMQAAQALGLVNSGGFFTTIMDCKCELMAQLGFDDQYKMRSTNKPVKTPCYEIKGPKPRLPAGWPPLCWTPLTPCKVGDPIGIAFLDHIIAAKVKLCGDPMVVEAWEHPYQGTAPHRPLNITITGGGIIVSLSGGAPGAVLGGITIPDLQQLINLHTFPPPGLPRRGIGIQGTICDP